MGRNHRGDRDPQTGEVTPLAKVLEENRQAVRLVNASGYLLDYHNKEAQHVKFSHMKGRYAPAPHGWPTHACNPTNWFLEYPPVLTYCAEHLTTRNFGEHMLWTVLLTERAAMLLCAWHRRCFSHMQMS